MSDLYDRDFLAWANEQAALLRAGDFSAADIAEEIESMGRSEKRELERQLTNLPLHLLKWEVQTARRGASWRLSVLVARDTITRHLADNPSLKPKPPEAMDASYRTARLEASRDTGIALNSFPKTCPWGFNQAMTGVIEALDEDG